MTCLIPFILSHHSVRYLSLSIGSGEGILAHPSTVNDLGTYTALYNEESYPTLVADTDLISLPKIFAYFISLLSKDRRLRSPIPEL